MLLLASYKQAKANVVERAVAWQRSQLSVTARSLQVWCLEAFFLRSATTCALSGCGLHRDQAA